MVGGTIFGEQVGKWALGQTAPDGSEAALLGKWIGETPVVRYPSYNIAIPERRSLQLDPASVLVGAGLVAALWLMVGRKKR